MVSTSLQKTSILKLEAIFVMPYIEDEAVFSFETNIVFIFLCTENYAVTITSLLDVEFSIIY